MIVTIDGPAGAGKSSAARWLAQKLSFDFLDTGAMYRAITLFGLQNGIDWSTVRPDSDLLAKIRLEMFGNQVILNGEDVSTRIRLAEVTEASGAVASSPLVRQHLVQMQRKIAAGKNIVCEGRDQGTIVFPHAECKFFLVAQPEVRAQRRFEELRQKGQDITLEEIHKAQEDRDRRDAARDIAPMVPADDATILDSSNLTLAEMVDKMEKEVRSRMKTNPGEKQE